MTSRSDPYRVESAVLPNGLEVFRQSPPPGARSFSVTFVAQSGWAHDADRPGLALLTSLAQVSAAGSRGRVELARFLDRYGATLGRQCAPESSEVSVWGPDDALDPLVALLADVVLRPRFESEDVERVRRQLLERQLRETTQPESRAERELLRRVFPAGHPYGQSGTGERRSVRAVRREELRRFHDRRTKAADAQLVFTARPPIEALVRKARRHFGELSAGSRTAFPVPKRAGGTTGVCRVAMPGRAQVEIRIGGPSLKRSDPEFAAAFLANEVLGGRPLLSRVFQNVRERAGLAYHASSDLEAMRAGGFWQVQAGTGPERLDRAVRLLEREVDRVRTEPVRPSELRRIRESAIGELPLSIESTQGAHELAVDVAYHHLGDDFLLRWPAELRKVGPGALRSAAEHAFESRGAVTVLAGPLGTSHPSSARGTRKNTHI